MGVPGGGPLGRFNNDSGVSSSVFECPLCDFGTRFYHHCGSPMQRDSALRGVHSPGQEGHQRSGAQRQAGGVLFALFSDPKTRWDTPTHFGPQGPEQVSSAPEVQDVVHTKGEASGPCGILVRNSRPLRTHISKFQSERATGDSSGLPLTAKSSNSVSSPLGYRWLPAPLPGAWMQP